MPLALSSCVLFISNLQLVNGGQFVSITFLFASFAAGTPAAVLVTVLFP